MKTIQQIHNDFDQAAETLVKISNEKQKIADSINEPTPDNDYEDSVLLASLGFSNISLVKKTNEFIKNKQNTVKEKLEYVEESSAINKTVEFYKAKFPFHKFILYSQVINICEKYNLYLAHSSFYKGEIPKKNIQELRDFPFHVYKKNHLKPSLDPRSGIFDQMLQISYYQDDIVTYICAPYTEFDTKNAEIIGKEIFLKNTKDFISPFKFKTIKPAPKDPIILLPVLAQELNQIGFLVITKWGLEAEDESLIVPENN